MIHVRQVTGSGRGMRDFVDLPYTLYRDEPNWCPLPRLAQRRFFGPRNPALADLEVDFFVAYAGRRPVGRVTAHTDGGHNRHYGTRQGFFGFYEAVDDPAVARGLMGAVERWVADRRMTSVIGPMNFNTKHELGFLSAGFAHPATFLMPYTHRYYPRHTARLGYRTEKELVAYRIDRRTPLPAGLPRLVARLRRRHGRGLVVRGLDMRRYYEDVEIMRRIYNAAWEGNWGFIPMAAAEMRDMARDLKPFAAPEFISLVFLRGAPAAFLLPVPDVNEIFFRIPDGRLLPTGFARLLLGRRRIRKGSILLMGVRPEFRLLGLEPILFERLMRLGLGQRRYESLETTWILAENRGMRRGLEYLNARLVKRYVVVRKDLRRPL